MRNKILIFGLLLSTLCFAQIKGKVVKVSDGDTFTILTSNKEQIKIRLYGIDAPERKQDFGEMAKQHLANLCAGKDVFIDDKGKDKYNRVLGIVFVDSINVNESLLINGLAWHYKFFSKSARYAALEKEACEKKSNVWSQINPIAPWLFRKIK